MQQPLSERLQAAADKLRKKDLTGACSVYRECVDTYPNSYAALCGYAEVLIQCERFAEARQPTDRALTLKPESPRAHFILSTLYQREGKESSEEEHLRLALESNPDHLPSLLRLAERLLQSEGIDAARPVFEHAIKTNPQSKRPRRLLASALEAEGKINALTENPEGDFGVDPKNPAARLNRLQQNFKASDAASVSELQKAGLDLLKSTGPTIDTLQRLGAISVLAGQNLFDDKIFVDAFNADPGNFDLFRLVTKQLHRDGRPDLIARLHAQHVSNRQTREKGLSEQLRMIEVSQESANQTFLKAVDQAWQIRKSEEISRETWIKRAIWGRDAHRIIHEHLMHLYSSPEEFLQDYRECAVEPELSLLRELHQQGRGVILATSHFGNARPLSSYLDCFFSDLTVTSSYGSKRTGLESDDGNAFLMTPDTKAKTNILRNLAERLKNGGLVAGVADANKDGHPQSFPLGKHTLEFSSLLPRLAYKQKVPSLFCHSVWRQRKLVYDFLPLPSPENDESRQEFIGRWARQYFAYARETLINEPEMFRPNKSWKAIIEHTPDVLGDAFP